MERHTRASDDTESIDPEVTHFATPQRVGGSKHGMVATAHWEATRAGVEVLEAGGNAVDAAVAAALALGVCEPQASGLGGQTMMTLYLADAHRSIALDGSSRAPNRATADAVTGAQRRRGHRATTVPSTPAVLSYTLAQYGTLPESEVLAPAIRIADKGYLISPLQNALMRRELTKLRASPGGSIFLKDGTEPWPVGSRFCQPALAHTLRTLAKRGLEDFYTGSISKRILADMQANDGLIQRDDLSQIPRPIERRPIATGFRERRVVTFPPPAAGRTLIEMLNIVGASSRPIDIDSPRGALFLARAIQRALRDRRDRPFDPNFYRQVVEKEMLSVFYAKKVARQIHREIEGRGETTHLSVMDERGNVVALTQSIELVYGSGAASPELGFLYNNYLSAFERLDVTHPYYLRPNAVPWASVAPTIVFRGRKPWLAIGSPGSERITSSILQVLLRLLGGYTAYEAVSAPRLHCSLEGRVSLEASRMRSDIPEYLESRGFTMDPREAFSFYLGCVQLVMRDRDGFTGVADPRRDGSAGGPRSVLV